MIITVASFKGGVGKTTTAFHVAAFLNEQAKTLLIDGDPNRSVLGWAARGELPFKVIDERSAAMYARQYDHIVIDTEARPEYEDLKALADGCDLLILPTTPDALALDALTLTVDALKKLGTSKFKVLLTVVPPRPERDGEEAREALKEAGLPVFRADIRRFAAYKKAALAGVPVYKIKAANAKEAWEDYKAVGKEIVDEQVQFSIPVQTGVGSIA
jgi:chromosome partitioning protein